MKRIVCLSLFLAASFASAQDLTFSTSSDLGKLFAKAKCTNGYFSTDIISSSKKLYTAMYSGHWVRSVTLKKSKNQKLSNGQELRFTADVELVIDPQGHTQHIQVPSCAM